MHASRPTGPGRSGYTWADATMAASRRRPEGSGTIRALLVDRDVEFAKAAKERLVGTSVVLTNLSGDVDLDAAVTSGRPRVLLLADAAGQVARVPALLRRHPGLVVVMVSVTGGVTEDDAIRAQGWGALVMVTRAGLLRGRKLSEIIRAAARTSSPSGRGGRQEAA